MAQKKTKPHFTMEEIARFTSRYSLGSEKGEGSKHFLRIKIPNGILTAQQFSKIAQLAEEYSKGYAEVTDRQDIELHWIEADDSLTIFRELDKMGFSTDKCGQSFPGAGYGDVRNIVGCPATQIHQDELIDTSPFVKELDDFFTGNQEFLDLPRKFKISISACPQNCTSAEAYDLSFVAVKHPTGKIGFAVLVGGTLGAAPTIARPLGVFIDPEDLVKVAKAIVEIHRDNSSRESKPKARFKWLVDAWGVEKLKKAIEEKIGKTMESLSVDRLLPFGLEHIGIVSQKQAGHSYISIPIFGGILSTQKMIELSKIAEEFGSGDLRLTSYQNIMIINVQNNSIAPALNKLETLGFAMQESNLSWTTIACTGNLCGKAPESTKKRAKEIVDYLEQQGLAPKNLDLCFSISGCPNGCARHLLADIGLQATKLTIEGKETVCYNIYTGRSLTGGGLGKLIARSVKAEDAKYEIEKLLLDYTKKGLNKHGKEI